MKQTKKSNITIKTVPHSNPDKAINVLVQLALKEVQRVAENRESSQ